MNNIGKGLATIGIWGALAYLGKGSTDSPVMVITAICAVIATAFIWES